MTKVAELDASKAIPGDLHSVASEIVRELSSEVDVNSENTARLQELVAKALVERAGVYDDVRMGRIMGSAISMI